MRDEVRRQADAHALGADLGDGRVDHLQDQPRPVLQRAAVLVGALVAVGRQELMQQVAIGGMDFDEVETGAAGALHGLAVLRDDTGDLLRGQRARLAGRRVGRRAVRLHDETLRALGDDGRRCDRCLAVLLQQRVRDAAHVPQLLRNAAALGVHGVDHGLPAGFLRIGVHARRPGIALALAGNLRGLGHDQARGGALRVVGHVEFGRHIAWLAGTRARERRHHDAVGEGRLADLDWGKQLLRHIGSWEERLELQLIDRSSMTGSKERRGMCPAGMVSVSCTVNDGQCFGRVSNPSVWARQPRNDAVDRCALASSAPPIHIA